MAALKKIMNIYVYQVLTGQSNAGGRRKIGDIGCYRLRSISISSYLDRKI